jgi:hypothetical protein
VLVPVGLGSLAFVTRNGALGQGTQLSAGSSADLAFRVKGERHAERGRRVQRLGEQMLQAEQGSRMVRTGVLRANLRFVHREIDGAWPRFVGIHGGQAKGTGYGSTNAVEKESSRPLRILGLVPAG